MKKSRKKPQEGDASYRNKSGKLYRGYAVNIEETVGWNGSVVMDYQFDKIHTPTAIFFRKTFRRWKNYKKKSFCLQMAAMVARIMLLLQKRKMSG